MYGAMGVAAWLPRLYMLLVPMHIVIISSIVVVIVVSYSVVGTVLWNRCRDKTKSLNKGNGTQRRGSRITPEATLTTPRVQVRTDCNIKVATPKQSVSNLSVSVLSVEEQIVATTSSTIAQKKTCATMLLLFVATAVHVICWLPYWL